MSGKGIDKARLVLGPVWSLLCVRAWIAAIGSLVAVLSWPLIVGPVLAQSTTAGVRLEAGIAKEDADGDIKSAMEIYQNIAADTSAPREVRAKALLRLAGSYEKLGRQARQIYEQIVRDFADQPAASQARRRLAVIVQQEHASANATMTVRKIEVSALDRMGPTDTDGQRGFYRDSSGSLLFGDLAGQTKRLVFKARPDRVFRWAPSRNLSSVLLLFPNAALNSLGTIAIIRNDGSGYRELIRNNEQAGPAENAFSWWCCRWSWDNRYFLLAHNPPAGGGRLAIVSAVSGDRRELLSLNDRQFTRAAFSPDGRFVAYETAPPPGRVETVRVFVVPRRGGESRLVYESATPRERQREYIERSLLKDWTADGRHLLIADVRYGKTGLYVLPINNGAPDGAPVLVRSGSFRDGQTSPAGAFIYEAQKIGGSTDIYIGSLEANGHLAGWRQLDVPRGNPFNPFPSFSPDGRQIAYTVLDQDIAAGESLILRDLSTGNERELYRSMKHMSCQYAVLHPNIFCFEQKSAGNAEVFSIHVQSGQIQRLGAFSTLAFLKPTHDDQALYLEELAATGERARITRMDLSTRQRTVVSDNLPNGAYESPLNDEWMFREFMTGDIFIRPMSGGEWKLLTTLTSGTGHVAITRDGRWILFHNADPTGKPSLFRISVGGGTPERIGGFPTSDNRGSLHTSTDGRQIAAVTFRSDWYDLWMLENFVPSGK